MVEFVGRYRIVRALGQGALGRVVAAIDEQADRLVAIKCLALPTGEDGRVLAEARARFLAEAEATRSLQHPDIAALLDAGEAGSQAWIVMELAPGVNLERYARPSRRLPEPVVLRIGQRLAAALAHAHRAGLIHRDLKPANVIVDWASDSLKLTDFGLARTADAEATRSGLVLGSPAYLAPEQLGGAAADVRSDLYALGVLMFELLCGRRPFDAGTLGELLQQVAQAPVPDLRPLAPGLPPAAAELVMALLAKRAGDRPASAAEVGRALSPWALPLESAVGGSGPKSHPG